MQQIHFLVTDFDGTYTNTHDVVSEPSAKSSDSPFIKELIQGRHGYKFAGVFGCTHRNTDGFYGFMQTSSWGVSAPAAVLINQKIAAIQQRLADHCCANGVPYYGTSTEYDASGIFTGAELLIAAEETSNNDKDLHHHRKLRQNEKNEQLRQIIEYISSVVDPNRETMIPCFLGSVQ